MAEDRSQQVTIEGLKDWQCEALAGVKVGDLLEVAVFTARKRRDFGVASEDGSEGDEDDDGEDGSEDAVEGEDGEDGSGQDESSGLEEPNTPEHAEPIESTTKQTSDMLTGLDGWMDLAAAVETFAAAQRDQSAVSAAEHVDHVTAGATGSASGHEITNGSNGITDTSEEIDENDIEATRVSDGDDESEDGSEEESSAGEDEDGYSDDDEGGQQLSRDLYIVVGVTREDDNDSTTISDVQLRKLMYQNRGEEADVDTYRIYGDVVCLHDESATLVDGEEAESLRNIATSDAGNDVDLVLNPNGDRIRETLHGYACPARCNRGWLHDQASLHELIDDDLETLRDFRPLCVVCLGKDLMNEQIMLRGFLDNMVVVDVGMVVEYLGRLNPRRRLLGYSFVQFDEREWGYGFDDMLDESGSERDEDEDGQHEHWDEAMDPNANPKTRPAPKETIAALPRKKYGDVVRKEDGASCMICLVGTFDEQSEVVELPCGHVYDEACLETWIKQYDNCPQCRNMVSAMVKLDDEAAAGVEQKDAHPAIGAAEAAKEEDEDEVLATAMDGEDTIMSDV